MTTDTDAASPTDPIPEEIARAESESARRSRRMTDAQWTDCKLKWASGQYSLPELSKLYGISKNAIWRRLDRAGIKKGQDAGSYENAAKQKALEETGNAAAERDSRIRNKAIETEEFLLNAVDGVARAGLNAIVAARKGGLPISVALDDVKTAKEAVGMFKQAVETLQKIRGEDKVEEDELPHLMVSGLTEQDIQDIRKTQSEEAYLFGIEETQDDLNTLDESLES